MFIRNSSTLPDSDVTTTSYKHTLVRNWEWNKTLLHSTRGCDHNNSMLKKTDCYDASNKKVCDILYLY